MLTYRELCERAERESDAWTNHLPGREDMSRHMPESIQALAWHVTQVLKHPCYVVEVRRHNGNWKHIAVPMPMVDGDVSVSVNGVHVQGPNDEFVAGPPSNMAEVIAQNVRDNLQRGALGPGFWNRNR